MALTLEKTRGGRGALPNSGEASLVEGRKLRCVHEGRKAPPLLRISSATSPLNGNLSTVGVGGAVAAKDVAVQFVKIHFSRRISIPAGAQGYIANRSIGEGSGSIGKTHFLVGPQKHLPGLIMLLRKNDPSLNDGGFDHLTIYLPPGIPVHTRIYGIAALPPLLHGHHRGIDAAGGLHATHFPRGPATGLNLLLIIQKSLRGARLLRQKSKSTTQEES